MRSEGEKKGESGTVAKAGDWNIGDCAVAWDDSCDLGVAAVAAAAAIVFAFVSVSALVSGPALTRMPGEDES